MHKADEPVDEGSEIAGGDKFINDVEAGTGRGLVVVDDRGGEADERVEAEAGGDLKLTVTPADGEEVAAGRESSKEEDAKDGEALLDAENSDGVSGKTGDVLHGGEGPREGACDEDDERDDEDEAARDGGSNGPEDAPGELDENAVLQGGVDDELDEIGAEKLVWERGADVAHGDIAGKAPDDVGEEDRDAAILALVSEESDEEEFGGDAEDPDERVPRHNVSAFCRAGSEMPARGGIEGVLNRNAGVLVNGMDNAGALELKAENDDASLRILM